MTTLEIALVITCAVLLIGLVVAVRGPGATERRLRALGRMTIALSVREIPVSVMAQYRTVGAGWDSAGRNVWTVDRVLSEHPEFNRRAFREEGRSLGELLDAMDRSLTERAEQAVLREILERKSVAADWRGEEIQR